MKLLKYFPGLLLVSALASSVAWGANPLVTNIFTADPSGRVFGDRLYVYTSHDLADATYWDMVDWRLLSTADLATWKDHGPIFRVKDFAWATRWAWAPDCVQANGKYYLFLPVDRTKIGVAVGDRPEGPFKDAMGKPLIDNATLPDAGPEPIDPAVLLDDDGQAYLYFGCRQPMVVKLRSSLTELAGGLQTVSLLDAQGKPVPQAAPGKDPVLPEGYGEAPFVFKRAGKYYFVYSNGWAPSSTQVYAIGDHPMGPFTYAGKVMEHAASVTQHGSVVQFKGKWYVLYHTSELSNGNTFRRSVCMDELTFDANGRINTVTATKNGPAPAKPLELPMAGGPFQPTMESLTNYDCPKWFRDAKFGIWAHWGPQAVPMEGDWYARKMYQEGSPDYQDHLARYGHPSTNGWKDIIPLWKAEQWEPEKLMALYKEAGARYFVSMGTHHDNFFLWNSPLHKWNAVNYGPHRDVVGEWQRAAKKNGLPFGVSEHLAASFTWFQDSHKSDQTGPLAGVPYDGASPDNWELYHFPAEPGDTGWYSKDPRWQQQWFNEIKELVDNYHPDFLYTDGGVPFGNEVGLSLMADLYNDSIRHNHARFMAFYNGLPPRLRGQYELERRGDKLTAVYTCKQPSGGRWVQDLERGVNGGINQHPWQTDTSIGDWFYNRHWKYQPLSWTVHMLVDIVSKNGNLLLNVVLRPDGSLDPEVETMLHQMAGWTAVNGEAIYGTRPWLVFGEGPVQVKGGAFKEDFQYSARDIRFTTRGKTLYAIALGWPEDGKIVIKSLARTGDAGVNKIKRVKLLGCQGKLKFTQSTDGLTVELPAQKVGDLTCTLKIAGSNLKPVPVVR